MALDKNWIEAFGLIVSLAFLIVIGSSIRAQVVISSGVPDHDESTS